MEATSPELSSDSLVNSPEESPRTAPEWTIEAHFCTRQMRRHGRDTAVSNIRDWLQGRAAAIGIGISDEQINDKCLFPGEFDITFENNQDGLKFKELLLKYVNGWEEDSSTCPPMPIIDVVLGESFFIHFLN